MPHPSWIGSAVLAVLILLSVSLFWRRFGRVVAVIRRARPDSGIIALLIVTLMVPYLAGLPRFGFDESSTAGRINWWAHTLALLSFLPLIPHTKHLHLVLSPVTVFLKRQGFSRIPPLSGDEDFGLDTGKDVTRIDSLQALSCVECGRCTEHCPASNTGKVLNPKRIILAVR